MLAEWWKYKIERDGIIAGRGISSRSFILEPEGLATKYRYCSKCRHTLSKYNHSEICHACAEALDSD